MYVIVMKNVQITVDEKLLAQVDRVGKPLGLKRSQIVRQALHEWLRKRAVEQFERDWIDSLQKHPDDRKSAEEWRGVQAWGDE